MAGNESLVAYTRVAGAAIYLSVGQRTVRELIHNGQIPAYRIGKKTILLKYSDLDAFMATKKETRKSQLDKIVDEILEELVGKRGRGNRNTLKLVPQRKFRQ